MLTSLALAGTLSAALASAAPSSTGTPGAEPVPAAAALGGDEDWIIGPGQVVFFDTVFSIVNNKPVTGGKIGVGNFHVAPGGTLVVQGPNPFVLTASGEVRVEGLISAAGINSPGVNTLNTTWIPELGAPGTAGGGQGGTGSFETTTSTAQGGPGTGAFGSGLGGGFGGETGWSNASAINARRGAGGGGGRFGDDLPDPAGHGFLQIVIGADAEPGFDNLQGENGAISGLGMPPKGGAVGASPFTDSDPANDHYGLLYDRTTGAVVPGELLTPWAGAGGGAGGDAARVTPGNVFPQVPFSANGDEKGAGGGGGGGSVHIMALGPIVFGPQGQINARGGTGGGGENTIFLNRVGGGSGGGSGGHVVLETASHIDLSAVTSGTALLATGGQGGAGKDDKGGAFRSNNGIKETTPSKDACPPGQVGCLGHVEGAGGDGGPGLIQLHVPLSDRPTAGLRLAPGTTLGDVAHPPPVGAGSNAQLLPTFLGATGSAEVGTRARRLNGEALRYRPGLGLRLRFE